jgi:hypothetical protein
VAFVQVIEFDTDRFPEVERLMDDWVSATRGRRTAQRGVVGRQRGRPDHYVQVVEFPSYEEAMANSALPETASFAQRLAGLCKGGPSFMDLDVVRVDEL